MNAKRAARSASHGLDLESVNAELVQFVAADDDMKVCSTRLKIHCTTYLTASAHRSTPRGHHSVAEQTWLSCIHCRTVCVRLRLVPVKVCCLFWCHTSYCAALLQGFPPMNKYGLQTVMKLASCYGLKSSAQGSGKKQFVVVSHPCALVQCQDTVCLLFNVLLQPKAGSSSDLQVLELSLNIHDVSSNSNLCPTTTCCTKGGLALHLLWVCSTNTKTTDMLILRIRLSFPPTVECVTQFRPCLPCGDYCACNSQVVAVLRYQEEGKAMDRKSTGECAVLELCACLCRLHPVVSAPVCQLVRLLQR